MNEHGRNRLEGYFQAAESPANKAEAQAGEVVHHSCMDHPTFDGGMIRDFFGHLMAELKIQYEYSDAYERGLQNGDWDVLEEDVNNPDTAEALADHLDKRQIWLLPHLVFDEANATAEEVLKAGAAAYRALKEITRRKIEALEVLQSTINSAVLCIECGKLDEDGYRLQNTAPFCVRRFIDEVSQIPEDILEYTNQIVKMGDLGGMGAD